MRPLWIVTDSVFETHLTGRGHPERPERFWAIQSALALSHLSQASHLITPRKATLDELQLCHSRSYIDLVEREVASISLPTDIASLSTGDTMISSNSFHVAQMAAGAVCMGVDRVFQEKNSRAFVPIRPPGHHACSNMGMGFCIFNNVAIGARYAQKKYGVNRVLIVDFDVHHGNGTQEIFYNDPSVFYFSTHQWPLYPGTGWLDEIGEGKGVGFTLNVPITANASTRFLVKTAFEDTLCQAMKRFEPELILISAGFDAHHMDPLGGFNLIDEDFFVLTQCVVKLANLYAQGRIVSVLEGGYSLDALKSASKAHCLALTESPLN